MTEGRPRGRPSSFLGASPPERGRGRCTTRRRPPRRSDSRRAVADRPRSQPAPRRCSGRSRVDPAAFRALGSGCTRHRWNAGTRHRVTARAAPRCRPATTGPAHACRRAEGRRSPRPPRPADQERARAPRRQPRWSFSDSPERGILALQGPCSPIRVMAVCQTVTDTSPEAAPVSEGIATCVSTRSSRLCW